MTRIAKIQRALAEGRDLRFDYMKLHQGRKSIASRTVTPTSVDVAKSGRPFLTGVAAERGGESRAFRVDRMFHVTIL